MTSQPALLAGAEPFSANGGPIGVVVSHGFTGTPASMRPWAEYLAAAGFTVRLPRLPGHGTSWQECNTTTWPQWYAEIDGAYSELAGRCEQVFAVGLSMGGTLVTKLAIDHPEVAGLVLVNPAYGIMRKDAKLAPYVAWLLRSQKGIGSDIKSGAQENGFDRTPLKAFVSLMQLWKVVVPDLGRITAPIRLFTSRIDHVVDPLSAKLLHAGAVNTTIDQTWLENSYHVATLDNDAQTIFEGSVEFINALAQTPKDPGLNPRS
jgi:carboxylesterase